jgi:predicted GNAT family N-acyltransferase
MQGVGIGMKLMEYAEEVAINHGCTSVILHARKTVMSWYESLNYEIIGDEFMEVGIPHYKMIKNL